jgi:hypothetical protein
VCQATVRASGLDEHLERQHDYLRIDGQPVPLADALKTLWQALLARRDEAAAVRLAGLFADRHGDRAAAAYRSALEAQTQIHAAVLGDAGSEARPADAWRRLGSCLAAHELTRQVCRDLLAHGEPRMRLLARLALLPLEARRLGAGADMAAVRAAVDALCPAEDVETRLLVCRRLAEAGASRQAAEEAARDIELDRTIPCPQCGQPVRRRDEALHLRQAHGLYELDGERLTWEQMLDRLVVRMLGTPPAPEAARLYVQVAGERLNDAGVVSGLAAALARTVSSAGAAPPMAAVAELPQAGGVALELLAGGYHRAGLALAAAIGRYASLSLLERIVPLAAEPSLSPQERRGAVEVILSGRNAEAGTAERALERYLAGQADPLLVLHELAELEQAVGGHAAIQKWRRQVRSTTSLKCPGCEVVLKLAKLEEHAWGAHRLVLERGAWRPAWEVIEGWLDEYRRTGEEKYLQQAEALARRDDAKAGPERLDRLTRQKGMRKEPWSGEGLKVLLWVVGMLLALGLVLWLLFR